MPGRGNTAFDRLPFRPIKDNIQGSRRKWGSGVFESSRETFRQRCIVMDFEKVANGFAFETELLSDVRHVHAGRRELRNTVAWIVLVRIQASPR